jgi:autotransporter-associated beta strand protein
MRSIVGRWRVLLGLVVLLPGLAGPAWAVDVTQKAHDAGNHSAFLYGTNWSDGLVPAAANDYISAFNTRTPPGGTSYVFGGRSLRIDPGGQLLFKGSNTITVGVLLLNGGGVWQGSAGGTPDIARLAGTITVQAPSRFGTDGAGRTFQIRSSITGDQELVFYSTFTTGTMWTNQLTTIANGGFTGRMVVSNRTVLVINDENRLGANPAAFADNHLTLFNGGTLQIAGNINLDDPNRGITVDGAAGGAIDVNSGNTVWSWLPITGNASFTKQGAGTLYLRVISNHTANTYSGGTVVQNGTLNAMTRDALGAGNATINGGRLDIYSRGFQGAAITAGGNGGTLALSGSNTAGAAAITLNRGGRLLVNAPGATDGATVTWNDGGIRQFARPDLLPSAALLVDGSRIIETYSSVAHPVDAAFMAAIDTASDGTVGIGVNNAMGVLDMSAHPGMWVGAATNMNVTFLGTIIPADPNAYHLGGGVVGARLNGNTGLSIGTLTGARDVVVGSTGVVTLIAGNTYSGRTIISNNAGVVLNSGNNAWGVAPGALQADNVTMDGGYIRVQNNVQFTFESTRGFTLGPLGGEFNIWSGNAVVTVDGPITGTGLLRFSDAGSIVLSAANTYAGGTLGATFLRLGNDSSLGTGPVGLTGGGLGSTGSTAVVIANSLGVSGAITLGDTVRNGLLTLNGGVDLSNATRTVTVNSDVVVNGVVANGGLTKAGAGRLTLNADNSYTNGTTINDGTLVLGSDAALGGGTAAVNLNGAGVRLQAADATARTVTNSMTLSQNVTLGAAGTGDLLFDAAWNNGGAAKVVTIDGITATFARGLTNTGPLTIGGNGTLTLGAAAEIPRASQIVVLQGATLDATALTAFQRATGSLEGGGTVNGNVEMQTGTRLLPGGANSAQVLTLGNNLILSTPMTNFFEVGQGATLIGTADRVDVGGDLEPNGAVVRVDPISGMTAGNYTLFTYGGTKTTAFNGTVLGAPGSDVRFGWNGLAEGGGLVDLVVTGSSAVLAWDGSGSAVWNTTNTAAWALGAEKFYSFDRVVFDDGGVAAVTVGSVVRPDGMVVSGSQDYAFTGTGAISGWTDIHKTGSGTLTLGTPNTFTGTVWAMEGTVVAGNNAALGSGAVGGTVVTNGATLEIAAGVVLGDEWLRLSGHGIAGTGAVVRLGLPTGNNDAVRRVTLDGDTTINTPAKMDFRGGTTRFLDFNGYELTKAGTSILMFVSTVFSNTGSIVVNEGVLAMEGTTVSAGMPGNIYVKPGAMLAFYTTPSYLWTNVMQGGVVGNYAAAGMANNSPDMPTIFRLESDTEFRVTGTGNSMYLRGAIDGPGKLVLSGAGNLYLRGTNSYSGGTLITNGRLATAWASVAPLGTGAVDVGGDVNGQLWVMEASRVTNAVTIRGNGWSETSGHLGAIRLAGTGIISGPVTLAADSRIVAYGGGDSGEIAGPISGSSKLELNWNDAGKTMGAGTITLSGDNSGFGGTMDFRNGTLRLGHDNALGPNTFYMSGGRIVPSGTVARTIGNDMVISNTVRFGGGAPTDNGSLTFNGAIGGPAHMNVEGFNNVTFNGTVSPTGVLTVSGYGSVAFNAPITEAAKLVANGYGGTLFLNAANTYTGDTIVAGRNLVLGNAGAIPTGAGYGNLILGQGTTMDLAGFSPSFNGLGGVGSITDSVGSVTTLSMGNNNATSYFSGALQGSIATLAKTGNGVLHLARGLPGGRALDVQAGRVVVNGDVEGPVTVAGGSTLEVTGNGLLGEYFNAGTWSVNNEDPRLWSPESLGGYLAGTNKIVEASSASAGTAFTFGGTGLGFPVPLNEGNNKTLSMYARWTGTFVAPTNGTYTFQTASDDGSMLWVDDQMVVYNDRFQGVTTRSGTIDLTAGEHDIYIAFVQGGGGLGMYANVAGANIPNSMLKMADEVTLGTLSGDAGATLSLPGNVPVRIVQASTQTFAGAITGAGPLVKDGPGLLELPAYSPFTGTLSVTAGTLRVNGDLTATGLISVHDGAKLDGAGFMSSVVVESGGQLAPGNSPGMMFVTDSLTLQGGATFAVELNGNLMGSEYDQVYMSGTSPTLTLNDPTLLVSLGFTPIEGDIFTIVSGFTTLAGSGTFNGLADGAHFVVDSTAFEIDYGTSDITLTVIPEPSALGAIGLIAMAVLLRRRTRR